MIEKSISCIDIGVHVSVLVVVVIVVIIIVIVVYVDIKIDSKNSIDKSKYECKETKDCSLLPAQDRGLQLSTLHHHQLLQLLLLTPDTGLPPLHLWLGRSYVLDIGWTTGGQHRLTDHQTVH